MFGHLFGGARDARLGVSMTSIAEATGKAGVSVPTVSHVLNKPRTVPPDRAVDLLIKRIGMRDGRRRSVRFRPALLVRQSDGAPA